MGRTRKSIVITDADSPDTSRPRPVRSPRNRENRLIALSYDLVEKRLLEGTATSQETTFFLKLGSSDNRQEQEIRELQKELMVAKTEALRAQQRMDEMYANAMKAMRSYNGDLTEQEVADDMYDD